MWYPSLAAAATVAAAVAVAAAAAAPAQGEHPALAKINKAYATRYRVARRTLSPTNRPARPTHPPTHSTIRLTSVVSIESIIEAGGWVFSAFLAIYATLSFTRTCEAVGGGDADVHPNLGWPWWAVLAAWWTALDAASSDLLGISVSGRSSCTSSSWCFECGNFGKRVSYCTGYLVGTGSGVAQTTYRPLFARTASHTTPRAAPRRSVLRRPAPPCPARSPSPFYFPPSPYE